MNLEASNVDEQHTKQPPSCCCFIMKHIIVPQTWKPLKSNLLSFTCLLLSIISTLLLLISLILCFKTIGYPTHSSSTPGVITSFISLIASLWCCYILYYSQKLDIESSSKHFILRSLKTFYINFFLLLFLSITGFITVISGLYINPLCLWYTFGSISWFIAPLVTVIIIYKQKHIIYSVKAAEDRSYSDINAVHSVNSAHMELEQPININSNHKNTGKCCCNRNKCMKYCYLQCCCPITLCIMSLLIVIQCCYSANNPLIQGQLYTMNYNGHKYKLQALCEGIRSDKYNFTIILSHGGGANSVSLQTLQNYLSNDFRVCVYTRPGYAWSDASPLNIMGDTNNTVDEMIYLMEHKLHENAPYVVIGHSVGGQLAKNVAYFYPHKVLGIILLDSVPDFTWQMIDSNGTYNDCVDVFNSRMTLLSIARFLTPFGLLRPFLGSQHDFGEYKNAQKWALNLDSMWNSQWAEMKWYSKHYLESYNMEMLLQTEYILGNISLLNIPAGLDENCTQAGYDIHSKDCTDFERKQKKFKQMHINQMNTVRNGNMTICPYPCQHDFAWTKADWIYHTIEPFLKNMSSLVL
eukprot:310432_1